MSPIFLTYPVYILAGSVAGSPFEGGKGDDLNFYVLKEALCQKSNRKISLNNFCIKNNMWKLTSCLNLYHKNPFASFMPVNSVFTYFIDTKSTRV